MKPCDWIMCRTKFLKKILLNIGYCQICIKSAKMIHLFVQYLFSKSGKELVFWI